MKRVLKYSLILLAVLVLLVLGAYIWFRPAKALNLALPNLNHLNHVFAKVKGDTAYIDVIATLENKAPYKIAIDTLDYTFKLAGVKLVSEKQIIDLEQEPEQVDTVTLELRLPIKKARGLIKDIQSQDSTFITADFSITYNTFLGRTTISVKRNVDIKVPRPPDFKLLGIKAGKLNLKKKQVDVMLRLQIKNNSDEIGVKLRDLAYNAKLGDNVVGKGSYKRKVVIDPLSTTVVELPIDLEYNKPFEILWDVIFNEDSMDYEVNLTGVLDNDSVQDVPMTIQAVGRTELVK